MYVMISSVSNPSVSFIYASTTPFSHTESAGNVSLTSFGTPHVEVTGLVHAHRRRTFNVLIMDII